MTHSNPEPPIASEPKSPEPKPAPSQTADASESTSVNADKLQTAIADFEGFAKLVAENLRYGSWTKRFVTVAGVMTVALNPVSAGKVAEMFGVKDLPKWYVTAFWGGLGGLGVGAIAAAVITLPKKRVLVAETRERQAIKGLRSFELEDAEIFAQLQRHRDVKECYEMVTAPGFRFGVLVGESGCGKSSLLQAGLLPRLLGNAATHRGVYVKFGDRHPLAAIRAALAELADETASESLQGVLEKSAQVAGQPIVLILDQFEQFFVQSKRPEDRAEFIHALKSWYESKIPVRIVVGIRGDLYDHLIELQKSLGYSLGPTDVLQLKKFSPKQATAVLKVMAETEKLTFDEEFVADLARENLASRDSGLISPVDVQVLAWMLARQSEEELRAFDQKAFQKLGGVEGLLQRFLERTLDARVGRSQRELTLKVLLALTDREQNVRVGTLQLEELQAKLGKECSATDLDEAVQWLARGDVRLVTRVEQETGVGYELAHERLIPSLLRVAKQELSAADQANQLLERRVNEWLGNGHSSHYLLNWQELQLLDRQRSHLTWGAQQPWKEQLWQRSRQRMRVQVGLWATPIVLVALLAWSNTTAGQLQWVRWQIMFMERLGLGASNNEMITAFTLDMVAGVKNNPLPHVWLKCCVIQDFYPYSYNSDELSTVINITEKMGDPEAAQQLLLQITIVASEADLPNELPIQARLLSQIAQVYSNRFKDEAKARQLLARALEVTNTIQDESSKADALVTIAQAYAALKDSGHAQQLLIRALEVTNTIQYESSKAYALGTIAQASALAARKDDKA